MKVILQDFKLVRIRNELYGIKKGVEKIKEKDSRIHGVNPIYNQIMSSCQKIDRIVCDDCELLDNDGKCLKTGKICKLNYNSCPVKNEQLTITSTFQRIPDKDKPLLIKYSENKDELRIPIDLILQKFSIQGKLILSDFEKSLFGADKTKYLYLKVRKQ